MRFVNVFLAGALACHSVWMGARGQWDWVCFYSLMMALNIIMAFRLSPKEKGT